MKSAKISELKNGLSRFLAYVRRGSTVRVYDRDEPVADLVPCRPADTGNDAAAELAALERDGLLRRASQQLPPDLLSRRLPKAKVSVVRALLDERDEGR